MEGSLHTSIADEFEVREGEHHGYCSDRNSSTQRKPYPCERKRRSPPPSLSLLPSYGQAMLIILDLRRVLMKTLSELLVCIQPPPSVHMDFAPEMLEIAL